MEDNRKKGLWEFCDSLRGIVPFSNIYENTIKLLFILRFEDMCTHQNELFHYVRSACPY